MDKTAWLWSLMALMILWNGRTLLACLEEERNALLILQSALLVSTEEGLLPLWSANGSHDCCSWDGVACNTMRVTELHLDSSRLFHDPPGEISLNASLLLPFEELQVLDLSNNHLTGLSGTLRMKKLRSLDFSLNSVVSAFPNIFELPALNELRLSRVASGNLILHKLEGLQQLEVLDLTSATLLSLDNLAVLWSMISLKALSVAGVGLVGPFPEGLCKLMNLEELYMKGNQLHSDSLPSCIGNMTLLRAIDLSYNNLSGSIPSHFFSGLTSLEFVQLSGNAFEGSVSLASLANSSRFEEFVIQDNVHQLSIETESPLFSPSSSSPMQTFIISPCKLNQPMSVSHSFFRSLNNLRYLDLTGCDSGGDFPNWLFGNNTKLEEVYLKDNNFSGELNLNSSWRFENLGFLDLGNNHIEGELPSNFESIFPGLSNLDMSYNMLHGKIPYSYLGGMSTLWFLDLSNNKFVGELPETLHVGSNIFQLKLSNNRLSGRLPQKTMLMGSFSKLLSLYLDNNNFSGVINPKLFSNLSTLQILDLSSNMLSGPIPDSIGDDLAYLQFLILSNNSLRGPLPSSFCKLKLVGLDLSRNDLSPSIPSCFNTSELQSLHLQSTNLTGEFPVFLSSGASSLVSLDLRNNKLYGRIPSWISSLSSLRVLTLSGNDFEATIPSQLCLLKNISIMDLSNNNFYGAIPPCLDSLRFGSRPVDALLEPLTTMVNWPVMVANTYKGKLSISGIIQGQQIFHTANFEKGEFVSKHRLEIYRGTILEYMSGLDLSRNNLNGSIPSGIGQLIELRALNLSFNHLTGPIPTTFSNLKEIESMDLSHNNLDGQIPRQLIDLNWLAVFSIAYNNMSGPIPNVKQFATFDKTSFEGNPFLCGTPLRSCSGQSPPSSPPMRKSSSSNDNDGSVMVSFLWTFGGSFVVALSGTVIFLCLNTYYRDVIIFRFIYKYIPYFRKYIS